MNVKTIISVIFLILTFCSYEKKFEHISLEKIQFNSTRLMKPIDVSIEALQPVSLAMIDENTMVSANYGTLIGFNFIKNHFYLIEKPQNVDFWNPTGVFYSQKKKKIYIANYKGNNIIEANLTSDINGKLIIGSNKSITHKSIISPENVSLSQNEDFLGVANYDGKSLAVFKKKGVNWDYHCQLNMGQAHGIAFLEDHIYVTDLSNRQILKSDFNCKLQTKIGSQGWDSGKNEYLWPTTITKLNNFLLLVVDAHQGTLTALDKQSLKSIWSLGKNGPGQNYFNLPYGATVFEGKIWIASPTDRRLVSIDSRLKNADQFYLTTSESIPWEHSTNVSYESYEKMHPQNLYDHVARSEFSLNGKSMCLSYGSFYDCNTKKKFILPSAEPFSPGYFFFLQALPIDSGVLLSSFSTGALLFIDNNFLLRLEIGARSNWINKKLNQLVNSNRILSKLDIENDIRSLKQCFIEQRKKKSIFAPFLNCAQKNRSDYINTKDNIMLIKNIFKSEPGKFLFEKIKHCHLEKCNKKFRSSYWKIYDSKIENANEVYLDEYFFIKMLLDW